MKKISVILLITVLLPQNVSEQPLFDFVIWNVGQGLWTSFITPQNCFHIDMGGEVFPQPVVNLCRKKDNFLMLTHEDWDHVNFISRFKNQVFSFCLFPTKPPAKSYLNSLTKCSKPLPPFIEIVSRGKPKGSENEQSVVYLLKNQILIPGDTTKKEEIKWTHTLPRKIRFLILAHHGSNTSTSSQLLRRADFKMAIASARKKRYGHPHPKVLSRLRKAQVGLLQTEQMGHIYLELP